MTEAGRAALVFVESNTSGTGRLFVRIAREMGFRPVLVTARPEKYAYLADEGAPEVIVVPRVDEDDLERLLRGRFGSGAGVAGITSSSEYFIATAAALAARFGLPGPDAASVRAARDKSHQRAALAAAGLPTPAFRAVASASGAVAAAREIGFPVVVKPVGGSGSVGVRACADAEEVREHAASLFAEAAPAGGDAPPILVESLIEGDEFSVEVFSGRVVGITRKHLGVPPHFVEAGHDYPAAVPGEVARELTETVTRATALLGLGWGPLHWELRMSGGRAYAIEVNPRLAGGFIPELVRHAEGIDLIRATLALVVGREADVAATRRRHASIRFLFAPRAGRLDGVGGVEDAKAMDGVADVALYRSVGDVLTIEGDFRDRIGHVIACLDGFDDACAAAEGARARLHVRIGGPDVEEAAAGAVVGAGEGRA